MPWMKRPKQLLLRVPGLMDSRLFCTNMLDSSLFQAWPQACPWGSSAEMLGLAVWAVALPPYRGFHCLSSLWPGYPGSWRIEFICFLPGTSCDSVSTGWESISFPVEVSPAYEPLLWSFISVFASLIATSKIQRWQHPCEVQWGETMNKDEDSSF